MTLLLASLGCVPRPELVQLRVEPVRPEQMRVRLFSAGSTRRVVNFWATWCRPCKEEIPRLRRWAKSNPRVEVVMVNLDLPSARQTKVEPFVLEQGVAHLTQWQLDHPDPGAVIPTVVPDWRDVVPVTLVISEQGKVTQSFHRALTDLDLAAL